MTGMDAHRDRILALLGLADDPELRVADAVPAAEDVDAVDAIGFDWPGEQAHITVYAFDDYFQASDAQERLLGYARLTDLDVQTTVNGDLLLWAVAPNADERARRRIADLASEFAGEE
ncbi:hypothetical protein OEB99_12990 [Actinotalea sp. M2MS4P-6]|uniref:hypothetical protein n=1 Tax=Actinotalea sp. M2MS4P-6 TaxID=2983762 RepID=UPI0021E3DE5C|nr:hypothetical protein [Actinotalea sp. M2MS4P-6]MCV2395227.1 hypothetical protein [Actinotalea sp. M2MS4P-6]